MTSPTRPGRPPMVCYADVLRVPGHPGVSFVMPYSSESFDSVIGAQGYSVPMVIVAPGTHPDDVLRACERFGRGPRMVAILRDAAEAWRKTYDAWHDPGLNTEAQEQRNEAG